MANWRKQQLVRISYRFVWKAIDRFLVRFHSTILTLRDAKIAKNYLSDEELKILNNLVSGYFDFAEIQAMRCRPMYMSDYAQQLDNILSSTGEALLMGQGLSVTNKQWRKLNVNIAYSKLVNYLQ